MHGSGVAVTTTVCDAFEKHVPSPLAGEGQGEGDKKP